MSDGTIPKPRSDARRALCAQVKALVDAGTDYRSIASELKIKSLSTVSRLYHENFTTGLTEEVREAELAHLDAWRERLEESAEQLKGEGERPEEMAKLATAAARISNERRKILAADIAPTVNVNVGSADDFKGRRPVWMTDDMAKWKVSDLYKADLREAGREEGTG